MTKRTSGSSSGKTPPSGPGGRRTVGPFFLVAIDEFLRGCHRKAPFGVAIRPGMEFADIGLRVLDKWRALGHGLRDRWFFLVRQDCCQTEVTLSENGLRSRLKDRVRLCKDCSRQAIAARKRKARPKPQPKAHSKNKTELQREEASVCQAMDWAHRLMSGKGP